MSMTLLCAIVQSEDADLLINRLVAQGVRLTRLNSIGGFLTGGNVTLLAGIENERFDDVMATIRSTCRVRTRFVNALPAGIEGVAGTLPGIAPLEVQVGGATLFTLPIKRFLRLQGGAAPPAADEHFAADLARPVGGASPAIEGEKPQMNLIIAIVHSDYVGAVTRALVAAGHRLTQLPTAGGFLRKSNATLLIGAEADQVDAILALIQANCPLRVEPNPAEAGSPMYGATVFVLETTRFLHI